MKKVNRMDPKAKSPDPDDLASEKAPHSAGRGSSTPPRPELRQNPDVSEPHVPPADDEIDDR